MVGHLFLVCPKSTSGMTKRRSVPQMLTIGIGNQKSNYGSVQASKRLRRGCVTSVQAGKLLCVVMALMLLVTILTAVMGKESILRTGLDQRDTETELFNSVLGCEIKPVKDSNPESRPSIHFTAPSAPASFLGGYERTFRLFLQSSMSCCLSQ